MTNLRLRIACSLLFTIFVASPSVGENQSPYFRRNQIATTDQAQKTMDNNLQAILDDDAKLEKLASGFQFTEGPLWNPDGFLLFSDIAGDTIYKFTSNKKAEVFRRPSKKANGNTLDRQGRLLTAQHDDRRVTRLENDGKLVTLIERYEGKRLNSPNDLVVKSDDSIYFTDPPYGISSQQEELGFYGVYRLDKEGKLTLLVKDFVRPNGIAFSPDEKKLYVDDSEQGHIRVFDVQSDGTLANGRVFAELKDPSKQGLPDGMKVDLQGNVYSTGPGGVWIFSPSGDFLGAIAVPEATTNLAWGDSDYKTLYITAGNSLYSIRLKVAGVRPGTTGSNWGGVVAIAPALIIRPRYYARLSILGGNIFINAAIALH